MWSIIAIIMMIDCAETHVKGGYPIAASNRYCTINTIQESTVKYARPARAVQPPVTDFPPVKEVVNDTKMPPSHQLHSGIRKGKLPRPKQKVKESIIIHTGKQSISAPLNSPVEGSSAAFAC